MARVCVSEIEQEPQSRLLLNLADAVPARLAVSAKNGLS